MPALLPNPIPRACSNTRWSTPTARSTTCRSVPGRDAGHLPRAEVGLPRAPRVIVPGSGTFGMEAVARQFATDKRCLIIRNGWFSFRWTQISTMGRISADVTVLKARRVGAGSAGALRARAGR